METIELLGVPQPIPEWVVGVGLVLLAVLAGVASTRHASKRAPAKPDRAWSITWPGAAESIACRALIWTHSGSTKGPPRPHELLPFINWGHPSRVIAESLDARTYRSGQLVAKPDLVLVVNDTTYVIEIKTRRLTMNRAPGFRFWMDLCQLIASATAVGRHHQNIRPVLAYGNAVLLIEDWRVLERKIAAMIPACRALPGQRGPAAAAALGRFAALQFHQPCYNGTEAARRHGEQYHKTTTARVRRETNYV